MEEYTKVTIQKKDTNCIIFNIEVSAIKESTCIEYRSPVFTFKEQSKEECYLSFVSIFSRENTLSKKVPGMTLHFTGKQASQADEICTYEGTYQVVCSILNRPEVGIHAFQSHRYGLGELKYWKFFTVNELTKAVNKNGIVQLCFDIARFSSGNLGTIESTFTPLTEDKMLKLYCFVKNEEYTDVIIKIGDNEIKAHKNILAASSAVFDAMFKSKMQEEQTGIIKADQFNTDVMREMLSYVYTSNVEDLPRHAHDLFEVAHFYNIIDLEIMCKDYMMTNITVDNVTALSELCEKYNLKDIQSNVNRYIRNNEAQVVKSQKYLNYLLARLNVNNVAKCLTLADKYKLKDFKIPLKEFVRDNIKEVIKDSKYRYLYSTNINLVLEIDEFMANHYHK